MRRLLIRALLPVLLVTAGWRVFYQFRAAQTARTQNTLEGLQQALRLDPQGFSYQFRLGVAYRDLPEIRDLAKARNHLEKAVELNPYSWRYRRELAQLYEVSGLMEAAEKAFLEAVRLSPKNGGYRWRLASFYIRTASLNKALPQLKAALAADGRLFGPALHLLLKAGEGYEQIDQVWPEDQPARLSLLKLLCEREGSAGEQAGFDYLERLLSRLLEGPEVLAVTDGNICIRHLIQARRFEEAREQWIELARGNGLGDVDFERRRNYVWNGELDQDVTQAELDWQLRSSAGCSVTLAEGDGIGGSTALRMDFNGTRNLDFSGVGQRLIVDPGRTYRLSFSARSHEISTDQGIYFEVLDGASRRILLATKPILNTMPWTRFTGSFDAGEEDHSVLVRLRRRPSLRFDNLLRGTLWVDSVSVELP